MLTDRTGRSQPSHQFWLTLAALFLCASSVLAQVTDTWAHRSQALSSDSVSERRAAARAFSKHPDRATSAKEALLRALEDKDDETCYYAILAVGNAALERAVPLLRKKLSGESSPAIRCAAAHALGRIGRAAADAAPDLAALLSSGDERLRCNAATALAAIGEPAQGVLIEALRDPNKTVRLTVANALRSTPVSPELREALEWASPTVALLGPSALPNGGFEAHETEMPGWTVTLKDGAEGQFALDATTSHSGRRSLRLTKSNGLGYIDLRTTQPVVMPTGRDIWTYRAHFRSDDAPISSCLLLRFEAENGALIGDESSINRAAGWQSQSLLRNTPPGQWDRRLIMRRQRKEKQRFFLHVILHGNPCTVWLDDIAFPARKWQPAATGPTTTRPVYSREEALRILATRPNATARVARIKGRSQLAINGKPVAPVLHMSVSPIHADFHLFESAGNVSMQVVNVSLDSAKGKFVPGKANWPGLYPMWQVGGSIDLTTPMQMVECFARRAPRSHLILGFHIVWPEDYVDRHPTEAWIDAEGRKGCGAAVHFFGFKEQLPKGARWWPSPYSEKAKADAANVIRTFLRELKQTPFAKTIAGTFISGGHDGQFYIGWPDHSPAGVQAWRQWLRRKYGSDKGLAEAWRQPDVTLDTAKVPPRDLRTKPSAGSTLMFHDPLTFAPNSDYDEFMNSQIWRIEEYFARVVKEELGKEIVALTWHMGGGWRGDFRAFLESDVLDAFVAQPPYEYRQPGHTGGISSPYESMTLHGKLAIKEMDTRSWLRGISNELLTMRIGTPLSLDHFRAMNRKELGQMIARGHGYWYYDISSSTYRHPAAMAEIRATKAVADAVASSNVKFQPDVALVYHTPSYFCRRKTLYGLYSIPTYLLKWQHMCINTAGVPSHGYFLRDLMEHRELARYKVYVFLNAFYLTDSERAFISGLKRDGNTLVWLYAPGYVSPGGVSVEGVTGLVGMQVATDVTLTPQPAIAVQSDHPLAKRLAPLQGLGHIFRSFFTLSPSPFAHLDAQRFWITDPEAAPLARYASDDQIAIAARRFPEWASVYVAPPAGLSSQLFNSIAREAGAYVVTDPGPAIHLNGSFLSIHGVRGGTFDLKLPRVCDVEDPFTKRVVERKTERIEIKLSAQETQWYLLR